jgi:hypothetical protein
MNTIKKLTIGYTDVFLENISKGAGKITISNTDSYNYSHYWGSMGADSIEEFICSVSAGYFIGKLLGYGDDIGEFDGKRTVRNIRRRLKEDFSYELPWYKYMNGQKEFREELKKLEDCYTVDDFIHQINGLSDNLYCFDMDRNDEKDFKSIITSLCEEPWYYVEREPSRHRVFLSKFFEELKKELKQELKTETV